MSKAKRRTVVIIHIFASLLLLLLFLYSKPVMAILDVIDSQNLVNSARQVEAWKEQLDFMRKQLEQAERQYKALTGNRGLGKVLHNPELRNYPPEEYKGIYDAAGGSNYGISGSITDIISSERLQGFSSSIAEVQKSIEQRSMRSKATNKAIGLRGYEGSKRRMDQIERLMDKISETDDPKAIAELQARIAAEQAIIQNESNKLQMIGQLQRAERDLIEEQKREMSRRILNPENTKMPKIK